MNVFHFIYFCEFLLHLLLLKGPLKKGMSKEAIVDLKGDSPKNPSNFAVMVFVIMQTAYQNAKNQRF